MNRALVEMLTLYILMIYLFQPAITDLNSSLGNAVEMVLDSSIQVAANEEHGMFTPDLIQGMKDTLAQRYFIDPANITFVGTTTLTARGDYIEGKLIVKGPSRWLFQNMFGAKDPDANNIVRYATQMSEALVR